MNETSLLTQEKKTRHALREETLALSRTRLVILLVPAAFAVGLFIGYLLWGRTSATAAANVPASTVANDQAAQTSQPVTRYKVDEGGNPAIGPKTAPVTIIEFSDYQCPYCIQWDTQVYKRLLQAYPDKIRFVYRDFPLYSIHPQAEPAAIAADCAGEQGRYYDYHDKLFSEEVELGPAAYTQYANELGLDASKFSDCVSSQRYKAEVTADYQYASNLGVRSTPTFFINGIAVIGAQPYETFKEIVDKELSGQPQ
jgi:protein-disulfide isomerase